MNQDGDGWTSTSGGHRGSVFKIARVAEVLEG